jgi:signal transduction histidine kinase
VTAGIALLAWRLWNAGAERRQYEFVFVGVVITFAFVIVFNFLFPAFLNNADLIPYGGLFQLPLILMTAYAILRHRLFNVKIAGTALIVFALSLVSVIEIIIADDVYLVVFRASVFALILFTGGLLIRSVYREVEQRELIEKQSVELEDINRQQESLLHFISHEVKGYLTKSEAAFAAIFAGDYGEVQPKLHDMSGLALADVRKGVDTVIDILDASNLRRGTVSFKRDTFDLVAAIEEIVRDLQVEAKARGLELAFEKPVTGAYMYIGDEDKLRRHVIRNLVDNSVKYTLKGFVRVQLARTPNLMRITISDSGVGITPEDMKHLFTEGGKGAESIKVNVHSTGYGLFIAKTIVEGHGGKVWAESEGKDKGSRFVVELPILSA